MDECAVRRIAPDRISRRQSASGLVPVTSRHGAEIVTGECVQWNIDHLQMGVGGDTSWGRLVHDEYTIPPKKYHYSFIVKPDIAQPVIGMD